MQALDEFVPLSSVVSKAGQLVHSVAAVESEYVPTSQLSQKVAVALTEYLPAPQGRHSRFPGDMKYPLSQLWTPPLLRSAPASAETISTVRLRTLCDRVPCLSRVVLLGTGRGPSAVFVDRLSDGIGVPGTHITAGIVADMLKRISTANTECLIAQPLLCPLQRPIAARWPAILKAVS